MYSIIYKTTHYNFIYKLPAIIYKPIIIYKGYNNPYKQGPAAPFHSYKY